VGILARKSAQEEGRSVAVPDFRNEAARKAVENDHFSPFPEDAAPGQPPASIRGRIEPAPHVVDQARRVWAEMGYEESAANGGRSQT
jgi:hypothetical protein